MKVEATVVLDSFNQIKFLLTGIAETIRSGDDGIEDSVESQAKDIRTIINTFVIDHLTPKDKTSKEHRFLAEYERLNHRTESFNDNIMLVKAKLYLYLKRELHKVDIPITLPEYEAHNFIYNALILDSGNEGWFFDDVLRRGAESALELIVKELYEQRRKFPQLAMTLETPKYVATDQNLHDRLIEDNYELPDFFK
ncbi:hypothetical protein [Mucilaginibacter glaciei]|uniref:Uncharacterized protein n=1 Tax=Mucilaginibacter glaciei TaxID=2772109 RepID=A0A926NN90_9SPHI|nr:hypothetical protein [Mucilaginibacter glaciei]MBD1394281.1 hypothetical protein [Mucilaginibacter glaciei]